MAASLRPLRRRPNKRHGARTLPRYIHQTASGKYRIIRNSTQIGPSHETVELAVAYLRNNTNLSIQIKGKALPNPASIAGKVLAILESTPGKHYRILPLLPEYNHRQLGNAIHSLRTRYLFDIAAYPTGRREDWSYQLCGHWRDESGDYHDYLNQEKDQ